MSKPNDALSFRSVEGQTSGLALRALAGPKTLVILATALIAMPLPALSGVAAIDGADPGKALPAERERSSKGSGGYQVRCWQMGRLLFEENQVTFPAGDQGRLGLKFSGQDRHGKPIYVAETANATCLIRSAEEERPWPRENR